MRTARVTISRPMNSHSDQHISIQIEDNDSSLTVLRISMSLADFAECLTGHGHMRANVERWIGKYADRIGKKLEVRDLMLTGRAPWDDKEGSKWVRNHPDLKASGLLPEWEIHSDGTGTQQNTRGKHRIVLCRYVQPPKDTP